MTAVLFAGILSRFARRISRRVSLLALCLAFIASFFPCETEAKPDKIALQAGYRTLSASLPAERIMLHMGVWYPTVRKPGRVKVGPWSFRAARGAKILAGPWPVIILSHDVTGTAWSHHDLASSLAKRGFIVAAPMHDRDNADDMRMLFTQSQLPRRALQASAALDAVLDHPQIGTEADRSRVAFLGFGMTAPAGLLLGGGKLTHKGWPLFRETFGLNSSTPASGKLNRPAPFTQSTPWSSSLLRSRLDALTVSLVQDEEERREQATMRDKAVLARERCFSRMQDSVSRTHQRQTRMARAEGIPLPASAIPLLPPVPQKKTVRDGRFSTAALISPGFSMLFTRESLADLHIPLLLVGAGLDPFQLPREQAEYLASMLPLRPQYLLLPEASPAMFQAPCPKSDPVSSLGGVCTPVPNEVLQRMRTLLLDTLQVFFLRSFGMPVEELP